MTRMSLPAADWWENAAYLDYRDSIAFYVSYFFLFADDSARCAILLLLVCPSSLPAALLLRSAF